ncbi:MAG: T9SS type A sorting domain-containing protein, partial [Bacteroidota bacterium]
PQTLSPGKYLIEATPYTLKKGAGLAGETFRLAFEVVEALGILVYPNPSLGQFQIQPEQGGTLEIFSPQGEQIWEGLVEAKMSQSLEIPEGKPGTYILRLTTKQGVIEKRIRIQ